MSADEHTFQRWYKAEVERWGGHVPSLVASLYMAGMPDLVINTQKGYTFYTELKFWRNVNPPTNSHQLQALLRGPQIAVIKHILWKRNIFCPIVCQIGNDLTTCGVAYKDKFLLAKCKDIAKLSALLDNAESMLSLFPLN